MKCTTETNNARAKAAKLLFFICQICKFVTFLLPLSLSCLLKLPNSLFCRQHTKTSSPNQWSERFISFSLVESRVRRKVLGKKLSNALVETVVIDENHSRSRCFQLSHY